MASWFKTGGTSANPTPPIGALRLQTSQQGKPKPIVWGTTRIAGNIIDYIDFFAQDVQATPASNGSGGGKGGTSGGGGKGQQGSVSYNYFVSVDIGLCEGPIGNVLRTWNNKSVGASPFSSGLSIFLGDYAQSAWGYMATAHPERALNYRGVAHVAGNAALGTATELPNLSFEVQSAFTVGGTSFPQDANPRDVVVDGLTNVHYGAGFPPARLDAVMTQYSNYCVAAGLLVSPALMEQREFSAFLGDLFLATNSSPRWSGGVLSVVPWGDAAISANGATYAANITPLYDITADNLLPNEGSAGSGSGTQGAPIIFVRKRKSDALNKVTVEFLDRSNNYDPGVIEAKDQASIDTFGIRSSLRQLHLFNRVDCAITSAWLQLAREQIPGSYVFTVGPSFVLCDVEDIVTLTLPAMGLARQSVRITEIQENQSGTLTFTAEEFLGTAAAPLYGTQAPLGASINYAADPGLVNTPIIFEPTDALAGGLQIWGGISGVNTALWGGCNIFASYDGITYAHVGIVHGPSRMGTLSVALPAFPSNPVGPPTIDTIDTLSVDLTESAATLASGSQLDATSLNTRCYVGPAIGAGEVVAYANAALTAASKYDLSYLVRGAYDTAIAAHPAGTPFLRLDGNIFALPFDASRIGATLYLKFTSFNIYGGGQQSLASVSPYTYVITGSALASPLPNVANLRTVFDVNSGFTVLDWDGVIDFRALRYEIRTGASAVAGVTLGTVAHPPFRVPGDGTYWVAAVSQPVAGLTVYSEVWQNVAISGAIITQNIIKSVDLKALNWPGIFTGGAGIDGGLNAIRTGGGDILTDPDMLGTPDVLNYGSGAGLSGFYYPDGNAFLDIGYVANASVAIKYQPTGVPVGQNVLSISDILDTPDILGAAASRFITVYPRIQTATAPGGDLYAIGDLSVFPDLYQAAGANWGPWQSFSPGSYQARYFYFSMFLETIDPSTIAYNLELTITITIPARIDTYSLTTSAAGNTTITFNPTGAAAAPFNGGQATGNLPAVQGTIINAQAGDDLIISGLGLSSLAVKVMNSGSAVARAIILRVEGF